MWLDQISGGLQHRAVSPVGKSPIEQPSLQEGMDLVVAWSVERGVLGGLYTFPRRGRCNEMAAARSPVGRIWRAVFDLLGRSPVGARWNAEFPIAAAQPLVAAANNGGNWGPGILSGDLVGKSVPSSTGDLVGRWRAYRPSAAGI
jgi:hypothetical protein